MEEEYEFRYEFRFPSSSAGMNPPKAIAAGKGRRVNVKPRGAEIHNLVLPPPPFHQFLGFRSGTSSTMDSAKPEAAPDDASSNSTMAAPLTFTLFPKLPVEIRIMVWKLTLEPRVVEIKFDVEKGFYSTINYPVALELCHESRQAVIQSYSLCFGSSLYPACTRFNFSLDTIYLDRAFLDHTQLFLVGLKDEEVSKIKHLAIDEWLEWVASSEGTYYWSRDGLDNALHCMTSLEEVAEVFRLNVWADNCSWEGDDSGRMELHNELPPVLRSATLNIDSDLPNSPFFINGIYPQEDS